jgi:hypothetical protein
MIADEYTKLDDDSAGDVLPERHTDRGTWGLTLALVCMTFWIIVFGFYRLYF